MNGPRRALRRETEPAAPAKPAGSAAQGRRLAIRALTDRPFLDSAAIDAFIAEHGFPIIEDTSTTFVFRGEADRVLLRHWVLGLPSSVPLQRIGRSDLWFLTMELPAKARIEYKFEVYARGDVALVEDPLNPGKARDPFGTNSVLHTAGHERPAWTLPDPESRPGTLEEIEVESTAFGETRPVTLYLPARFRRTRRYPLLVVHDGGDFLQYAEMKTVLDNLIHRLDIASMMVAFTHPSKRLDEYANDPRHQAFITSELVPHLEARWPLMARPPARGLMGASFGAVASLSTAAAAPGFYGRLLLLSGSFAFTDIGEHHRHPVFDPVVEFMNGWRDQPVAVTERVFVSCGTFESLIYENRSLVPLLQATGMEVRYTEARDGHNWENWRDQLRAGLSWLFPGPLWMVYE